MSDFVPPPGPPPKKYTESLPEGYKAVWNEEYQEWFFVDIYTKQSTWTKPTRPVYASGAAEAPGGAPPGYARGSHSPVSDSKTNPFVTHNSIDEDEALARKLQAEEDDRAKSRGAMQDYQNTPMPQSYGSTSAQPPYGQANAAYGQTAVDKGDKKKGLFSKILGAAGGSKLGSSNSGGYGQQQNYGHQGYGQQNYGGQQGYGSYGGAPPMGYQHGFLPQQGYAQGGYGGGYGGGYQQQQAPQRTGGLGMGGGLALGAAGGLVGGMLLENAIDDHDQNEYQDGYQDGQDNGGGDYGGDDGGGGGGDF